MMCIEHRAQYDAQSKDSINVGYFGSVSKEYTGNSGDTGDLGLIPVSGRFPWRRKWQPTLVFLPEKSQGIFLSPPKDRGAQVGNRSESCKELDTT